MKILNTTLLFLLPFISISQEITSVSPSSANAGETLDVTITGLNTTFTQGSSTGLNISNYFGQGSASILQNSYNVINDTSVIYNLTVQNTAISGNYDFSMYNSNWQQFGLENAFFVNAPSSEQIVSVSPSSANAGATLDVTITGLNTTFTQGSSTGLNISSYFGQGSASILQNSYNVINDTSIVYNLTVQNTAITGNYDFSMYNSNWQQFGLQDAFYVGPLPPPSILSVSPSTANAGETLNVTITGVNTHFTQASSTSIEFSFDPINGVNSYNIISDTEILANVTVPSNVYSDFYDVHIDNNIDGNLNLFNSFEVIGNPCSIAAAYTFNDNGSGNYTFSNTSSGNIVNVDWNFGDGNSSINNSPSHTFVANGDYVVVLTVTDSLSLNGYCFDYQAQLIQVTGVVNPVSCNAGFSMIPDTSSNYVYAFNNSTGNNLSYFWDFGDGNTSTDQFPNYTYLTTGPFYLCLTVDDGVGCNSVYCDSIGIGGTIVKQTGFTINVTAPNTLGISDPENYSSNLISIYPNPGNGMYTLDIKEFNQPKSLKIYDIQGNLIFHKDINIPTSIIDIRNVSSGIYLVKIEGEKPIRIVKE